MSSKDHRMALPPGARIQGFAFDRVLGHGGFGITYLGRNIYLDMPVAIKEYLPAQWAVREQNQSITPKSTADEKFFNWGLERFLDEAQMMARFKHPNIVQVQHFFQSHGTAYIVMEYVKGETLDDLLKQRGTLTEQELKDILLPLLAGLMAVHEAGILHRDIKPANILLRVADGSPVLADFGAARQDVGARSRLTEVRTRHYAPLEQYSEKGHQGPWTDIYALGAVCYQALLGKVPVEAIARLTPPDPLIPATQAGKGKAEAAFLEAMDWALQVQGPGRPQEISPWQEALLGARTVPQKDRLPTDRRSGTSGWLMALGVLLLAGAGTWWGWQQYPQWFGQGDDVARLLAAADANLRARRLTSPADNNAWDMYRRVLNLQPGNSEAMAGMERVIKSYMELFNEAMGQKEFDKASGYLSRIKERHPDSPMLKKGQQRLKVAKQVQAAERERRRQTEEDVARLLAAADANLRARRLTSPADNNAWDMYRRVLNLQPGNSEAVAGMERVIKSYMELFNEAMGQKEFDKASGYLSRIKERHPDSPMLKKGQQRLKVAKQVQAAERERRRQTEEDVARLLAAADANLRARRLTSPADNNAWDMYRRVLNLQPGNSEAVAGMERVITSYMELFDEALGQKEFDKASGYLSRISELHPDSPLLEEGQQRLKVAKQVQAAERERRRQTEEDVARLLAAADANLRARRLTSPADNNAWDMYRRVLNLQPGNSEAVAGMERVITSYMELFDEALGQKEFDKASGYLSRISELHPDSPLLEEGQQRLEVAKQVQADGCALNSHEFFRRTTAQEIADCIRYGRGDINSRDEDDMTPLHLAAIAKPSDRGIIAALLEAGADVNSRNRYGQTPLHYVAWRSSVPGVITALVEAGADANIRSRDEDDALAPLHMAARFSSAPGIIAALVEAGADVNIRNRYDRTPLYFAARYSAEPSIMAALLAAGANPKLADRSGKAPWDYIQKNTNLKNTDAYRELEALSR